jgi:hypothetical protein
MKYQSKTPSDLELEQHPLSAPHKCGRSSGFCPLEVVIASSAAYFLCPRCGCEATVVVSSE